MRIARDHVVAINEDRTEMVHAFFLQKAADVATRKRRTVHDSDGVCAAALRLRSVLYGQTCTVVVSTASRRIPHRDRDPWPLAHRDRDHATPRPMPSESTVTGHWQLELELHPSVDSSEAASAAL